VKKRALLVVGLAAGLFVAAPVSANAYYCNVDPNLAVGTPINYSLTTSVTISGVTLTTNNSGSTYQHFDAGFGIR
jgi:riboflavin transporter FmnP